MSAPARKSSSATPAGVRRRADREEHHAGRGGDDPRPPARAGKPTVRVEQRDQGEQRHEAADPDPALDRLGDAHQRRRPGAGRRRPRCRAPRRLRRGRCRAAASRSGGRRCPRAPGRPPRRRTGRSRRRPGGRAPWSSAHASASVTSHRATKDIAHASTAPATATRVLDMGRDPRSATAAAGRHDRSSARRAPAGEPVQGRSAPSSTPIAPVHARPTPPTRPRRRTAGSTAPRIRDDHQDADQPGHVEEVRVLRVVPGRGVLEGDLVQDVRRATAAATRASGVRIGSTWTGSRSRGRTGSASHSSAPKTRRARRGRARRRR